ncbi:MAG: chorismate mutase [Bacteroidota bacterium]
MNTNLTLESIKKFIGVDKHLIISGPCSAETEDQVMSTCERLNATGKVNMLRAGIWKPRTRPNSFEGVGEVGLEWLVNAGKATGLKTTTEVAKAEHVEKALKNGIDVLWIGARTTVNPFSVQEVADALKGVDVPVMVKNPINPDLALWIGALERLNKVGITKLAAIHRGFATSEATPFRNVPKWEIAIKLKTIVPDLEIICDPSHISGNRELIPLVSQKALDLDMDGLMIESHIHPSTALSDAQQQMKPAAFGQIIDNLVFRKSDVKNELFNNKLEELREQIDKIDDDIIHQFGTRMGIAEQIGIYKKENKVTVLQVNRWKEILEERTSMGKALGLSEEFIEKLLELIHKESINRQNKVMNEDLVGQK